MVPSLTLATMGDHAFGNLFIDSCTTTSRVWTAVGELGEGTISLTRLPLDEVSRDVTEYWLPLETPDGTPLLEVRVVVSSGAHLLHLIHTATRLRQADAFGAGGEWVASLAAENDDERVWRLPWDAAKIAQMRSSVRRLLKMHGCVSEPPSIVLTRRDYMRYEDGRRALRGDVARGWRCLERFLFEQSEQSERQTIGGDGIEFHGCY